MSNIHLSLTLEDTTFLETASIPFVATLRNTGADPLTLHDFTPANQAITLVAEGEDEVLGTQISWKLRNGERFHEPREFSTFELGPGEEAHLAGDALEWLGTLPPGTHTLYAAYNSGMATYAESEPVEITIRPAHPVTMQPVVTPSRPAYATIPILWHHAEGEEGPYALYLLDTSPFFPPNYYRNVQVATVPAPVDAVASVPLDETVTTRHVAWLDGEGRLHVVTRTGDHGVSEPQVYTLGSGEATLLSPALTAGDGLHLVATTDQGVLHVTIHADGRFQRRQVSPFQVGAGMYELLWGGDGNVHLLARNRASRAVSYLRFVWRDAPRAGSAEVVALPELGATVRGVALYEQYAVDREAYTTYARVLAEADPGAGGLLDAPRWQQWRINLGTMTPEGPDGLALLPDVRPYAMVLNGDHEPRYLFTGADDQLWFFDPGDATLVPVFDAAGQPALPEAQPALIPTAPLGRKGKLYLATLATPAPERTELQFHLLEE